VDTENKRSRKLLNTLPLTLQYNAEFDDEPSSDQDAAQSATLVHSTAR